MTDGVVRVALADDDHLIREGIAAILENDPHIEVTVRVGDGGELVRELASQAVDVALIDVRMPRLDGLDTLVELARQGIAVTTAMLTTFSSDIYVETAIMRGAQGFLLKSETPNDLIRHVKALAQGGAVFSPRIASWLLRDEAVRMLHDRRSAQELVAALTGRQRDILALLATGVGNAEIAVTLHLSEGTVKQYLRAVFDQLGVQNRVQAALIGYRART